MSTAPALARCLKTLQPGDTLIVWKLDRLGRSLRDLIHMRPSDSYLASTRARDKGSAGRPPARFSRDLLCLAVSDRGGEGSNGIGDLVQKRVNHRTIIDFFLGHFDGDDLAAVGIDTAI
jgi:hypothetical protein